MYLLDTNVISESTKGLRNPNVTAWFESHVPSELFLSVMTIAELRNGIERLPAGRRKARYEAWLVQDVISGFARNILSIDLDVADLCGHLMARIHQDRVKAIGIDVYIAATAKVHGLTILTRNTRDFDGLGVPTVDPWSPDR